MSHSIGSLLFMVGVFGNALAIVVGLAFGAFVIVRRAALASRARWRLAMEHDRAFHHPDRIRTPLGELLFMAGALVVVLVGLPVILAILFEVVIPALGRLWTH